MANPYKDIYLEVRRHYNMWREDNQKRKTRKGGWDDVTDAFMGKLPIDWPYTTKVTDPRVKTSLTEKNARLLNAKLRGRLVPREGGDVLKARLNNALLDFQWDNANDGGSMLSKWAGMDMGTRLFQSRFAFCPWKHEETKDGKVIFDGNEFYPLDNVNCGMDPNCDHIRNAKWFQLRDWVTIEELERVADSPHGKRYPGISLLKRRIEEGYMSQNRRDTEYVDRVKQNKGLQDRVGEDKSFPVIERVREFRKDRWICIFPKYDVTGYDIPNPYDHGQIPIVQLRYYPLSGDNLGESEVEPVIPLWKAICAAVCGYLDNQNIHIRPPLKILEGSATISTIIWDAEAQWMMTRPDAVTEMQSNGEAMQYFQTTYPALVSAFNTAMGDISQGVSSVDPLAQDKTATEVRQTAKQQNVRDQSNQMYLAEAIQDMMMMWLANNRQFLFIDPDKHEYLLRIVGSELFEYFKRAGLDEMEVSPEGMQMIGDIIQQQGGNMSDQDVMALYESAKQPKYPVFDNPKEKDPTKLTYKSKMRVNDMEDGAELSLTPDDIDGNYDYIADTVSMQAGASEQLQQAQQIALASLKDPTVLQLLQMQGVTPQIKELLISTFDAAGLKDSERFFQANQPAPTGLEGSNGLAQPMGVQGIPGQTPPQAPGGPQPGMAGPPQIPQPGGLQPGIPQGLM